MRFVGRIAAMGHAVIAILMGLNLLLFSPQHYSLPYWDGLKIVDGTVRPFGWVFIVLAVALGTTAQQPTRTWYKYILGALAILYGVLCVGFFHINGRCSIICCIFFRRKYMVGCMSNGMAVPLLGGAPGTPTITMGSAAGTSATGSIVGNNVSGKITMTSGISLLSTGTVLTLTLANGMSFPNGMHVLMSAANGNMAGVLTSIYSVTTTNTSALSVAVSLGVNTTYIGYYLIVGY